MSGRQGRGPKHVRRTCPTSLPPHSLNSITLNYKTSLAASGRSAAAASRSDICGSLRALSGGLLGWRVRAAARLSHRGRLGSRWRHCRATCFFFSSRPCRCRPLHIEAACHLPPPSRPCVGVGRLGSRRRHCRASRFFSVAAVCRCRCRPPQINAPGVAPPSREMQCHDISCHVISCHFMSCHVMPWHGMAWHVTSRHGMSGQVRSCHIMPCHVMSWHVMSCRVVSCRCRVVLCHIMLCHGMFVTKCN